MPSVKKIFNKLIILIGFLLFTSTVHSQCCDITIDMQDSYGDGWNGGFVEVTINGAAQGPFSASGNGSTATINYCDGDVLIISYTSGAWETENTYTVTSQAGVLVSDGPSPSVGQVFSSSNACSSTTSGGGGGGGCGDGTVGGNCANALVVNAMPYSVTGLSTCGAGDCYSSSSACGSSYMNGEDYVLSFTPSATGSFEFVTNSTTTWTGIFVLDGCPDSGGANCIGSDTQSGGLPNIQNLNLTGGQTYYIVISTYPSPNCTPFDLTINEEVPPPGCGNNPAAADLCANAVPICDLSSYCGNTSGAYTASFSTQINAAFCGSIENSSYMSFVADASSVSFDVNVSNCAWNDGVQMMIFGGGCSGAITNYGCVSPMSPGITPFNATGLTAGNTYYLIVDGWAGDICDYQIITNNGVLVGADAGQDVSICPGGSATLTATGGDGTYTWSPGGATTSSITVSPGSTATYTVSSNMGNPLCGGGITADDVVVTVLAGTAPTITGTSVLSGTVGPGNGQTVIICDGGSANLTATGGGTYSWSPSTGLSSGTSASPVATPTTTTTYTVTVDDGNGCIGTASITIQVDPAPAVTVNSGTICVGESINLVASGATTYVWTPTTGINPTTGAAVSASPTTTTNYTVTGSTVGCPNATAVAAVTVIPLPTANFNIGGDFCLATNDVDFNNQPGYGGSGTYSWTFPGATPATAANQNPSNVTWPSAGTYNVTYTVTVNGCINDITLPITINATPTVTAIGTDALCFGNNGSIIASTASAGASYSWSSGQNSAGPHAVGAGTYTVTLTDGNGCIDTDVATVAIPTQVVMTSSSTNALCFGVCNGTLTGDNASGGAPGYTYSWDGGPSSGSQTQTNVCAGTYVVTATDANGCPATSTETITVPTQLTVTAAAVDASCSGVCDGDVTSLGAGGTAPMTYSWSVLGAGQDQLGSVCAGTYTVTVTDANGCMATADATVAEPTALAVVASGINASCNAVCDGTAASAYSGGTVPYTYSWDNGAGNNATASALCAGTYTITLTDAQGCTAIDSYTVTEPVLLTLAVTGNDASCNGVCDGNATAVAAGGTGVHTYQWDAAGGLGTAAATTSTLCSGTAGIAVADANGCAATGSIVIAEPIAITLSPASNDATCGASNGDVSVIAAGGTPGYTYLWDDLGASTTLAVGTLPAGTYTVIVTDAQGCTETISATINDLGGGVATPVIDNQVSCFGVCDGGGSVTMAGGTAPFTFLWSSGQTTDVVTGFCAGIQSVDVTDALGCVASASIIITEPVVLTAAITSSTDPLCNGVCDGTADVTAAGGTTGYTYAWTSGGNTANETATCAGTATVTVTDANGCATTADVTLADPALLTAAIAGTGPLCNGVCDGSADLTTTGGTGALTYLWDDPATSTSEDVAGLCDGIFNVTVTDANGCIATDIVTVTEPTVVVLTTSGTDANCGQADGEVCVVPVGGTGVYTYAWNDAGAQTTACASNIVAGTYNVTVTDAQGCVQTASVTINDAAGPTATASVVIDASGFGLCDAEVTVAPIGGSGTYTYLWDDGVAQTTQNATGLCAGTYCVIITDALTGCSTSACVTVIEPVAIILTITTVDLLCNGICIGEADATVSGGIPPYIYSWSSGATAEDLSGLCAGSYTLTVVDGNGVTASQTISISEPMAVSVTSVTGTNLSCNALCDGTLGATATGGTGGLTYLWDGGPTPALPNQTLVCAGTYNLTVTDNNGCTATDNYSVNEPILLLLTTSQIGANCSQSDGEACLAITGGTALYTQIWDDDLAQTTMCASNIPSGTYNVTVTDANGCIASAEVIVNDMSGGTASIAIDNNASCNTYCDGQATVTMTGGGAPYTYLWDSGASANSATNTDLCAGPINVIITDNVGCVTTAAEIITEPSLLAMASSSTDAICNGYADGTVSAVITGGTVAIDYIYDWENQATAAGVGNTPTISALAFGTYCLTVTDDNGCAVNECVTIAEPTPVVLTVAAIDANCNQSDGAVAVTASSGGSGFYNAEVWVDGLGNPVANTNAVLAGAYTVTISDNVGCMGTALATVSDLSGPTTLLANQVDATCNGYCDGEISVAITGGLAPYTSVWSPLPAVGQGTTNITGLCAGTYALDVTDLNGCTSSFQATITEPGPIATSIVSALDASGSGLCDGVANVTATGGTGVITYIWFDDCAATSLNGSLTGSTVAGLCASDYAVVSADLNGCADTLCITISEPNAIITTLIGIDITCFSLCDGQATVAASGGTPGFTYNWMSVLTGNSIGQTSITATALCAGDYFVIVTDANGIAHNSAVQTINEPAELVGSAFVISNYNGFDISCFGACDGSAEVNPSGGTAPYTYAWDALAGNQTTSIATNLCAETYSAVVTDANGCFQTFEVVLSKPPVLGNVFSFIDLSCNNLCDGAITSNGAGGTPPFAYQWNDLLLSTSATIDNLCAGAYDVTITDANGCILTESQSVTEPVALVLAGSMTGSNCNQNDGSAQVTIVSGVTPFTFLWDAAAANQTTAIASNLFAGCYDVTVTDGNGCIEVINICVVDLGAPSAIILTQIDVSCNAGCDGFAQIQVFGGTPPLNYTWYDNNNNSIGQTTASALSLCAGTYVGEMIDNVGCQVTLNVIIEEPTALNAVISVSSDVTCFGYADGTATVVASGGTAPYTYAWNDSQAQTTASTTATLFSGVYTVTVTDALGCTFNVDVVIGGPLDIQLATSFTDAFCGSATGDATVTATNGILPFTYAWDDALMQSAGTAINLIPDTYTVTIVDADGCVKLTTVTVGDIPGSAVLITSTTDALCFGDANGTATASVSGTGTAPYQYEWFNASNISQGQDTIIATGLAAGDYYVSITDANGCVSSSGIGTVNQPIVITATTAVNIDASCSGNCDGEASSIVLGGSFPYTYQWDDPLMQTTITAFNLCAQTYNVTITDANGCSATAPVSIAEPAALALDSAVVNANCGLSDGNACIISSGGTGPYTYLWPDASTNSCAANLLAGTYCILVTDANGCSVTICPEVQDLNGPSAMILDTSMVSCTGFNDGSATIDMIGGNGFFTALWDINTGSQTTPTASNLTAGFYAVTITDSVGCNASISIEITEPDLMISIQTIYNTVCLGSCDGTASLAAIGGTLPYSYSWVDANNNNVGIGDSIGGLCAGAYILSIVDAMGCTDIINYSIGEPDQVTGSASATDVSCFGACDGTATAMGIVGMTPFSYQWGASAGNQTGATAFGLCSGNYICTITDADGCQTTVSAIVTQPILLQAAINLTGNVSCNGYSDGFAEVSPSGGTGAYTYFWDNGAGSQVTASSLLAGIYTVTMTDENGCVATASITITEPTALALTSSTINVDCFGNCNGSASVITSGGSGGNTYQWNDPTFATTAVVNNLCIGTYTCIITNANGCTISETVNITQPTQIGMNVSVTQPSCGFNSGLACVNVFGGTIPYVYQWNDVLTQTTACASNLVANCYTVTAVDGNGCFEDSVICLNDIEGPIVTFVASSDVTCFGDQDGTMQYAVAGGTGSPTLEWINDVGAQIPAGNNVNTLFGLDGGCYTLTATDLAGCVSSGSACIVEPSPISSAIFISNVNDASCNTACDGDVFVNVSGGSIASDYTYNWNIGQTTQQAIGLCTGTYTVEISDDNNCTNLSSVTISEPTPIVISIDTLLHVSCTGFCDGQIQVSVSGGTAPYLYNWNPLGLTNPIVAGLCAGTYTVRITDANGCNEEMDITIMEPPLLVQSVSTVNTTCSDCNGTGIIAASGGTAPYYYSWFGLGNSPGNSINSGLCGGFVPFEVTDANGCVITSAADVIDEASPVIDSIIFIEPLCSGHTTGSASVYASGGTLPYNYLWDDDFSQQAQTAVALEDDLYSVQVTDANDCMAFQLVNVTEPLQLYAVADIERTICYGESTQVWASGQGGTPAYTVVWDNLPNVGSAPVTVAPLSTAQYCATIVDANGCLPVSSCVTITVTPALALTITPPIYLCFEGSVDLVATATGGDTLVNPYSFTWHDDAGNSISSTEVGNISTVNVSPSTPTTYYAVLTDGCSINDTVSTTVSINPNPQAFLAAFDSAGCAPFAAQFVANSDIGSTFEFDTDCDGIPEYSGPINTFSYTYTTPGEYDVCLDVISADGCFTTVNSTAMITVHDVPVASFSVTPEESSILNPAIEITNYSIGGSIYAWDFGDGTSIIGNGDSILVDTINIGLMSDPTHLYSDTGYFDITLTVFSVNGVDTCESVSIQTIHVAGDYIFFAPSAFTPNGDGKNDVFIPKGFGIDDMFYDFYVFNRWGEQVFESHNKDFGWDGKHKGILVQIDAYVWLVRTTDTSGESHEYVGNVTVVK